MLVACPRGVAHELVVVGVRHLRARVGDGDVNRLVNTGTTDVERDVGSWHLREGTDTREGEEATHVGEAVVDQEARRELAGDADGGETRLARQVFGSSGHTARVARQETSDVGLRRADFADAAESVVAVKAPRTREVLIQPEHDGVAVD